MVRRRRRRGSASLPPPRRCRSKASLGVVCCWVFGVVRAAWRAASICLMRFSSARERVKESKSGTRLSSPDEEEDGCCVVGVTGQEISW